MINKENLDKRICDCEEASNTQTYREFIRESENALGLVHCGLDGLLDHELKNYLDWIDYLLEK